MLERLSIKGFQCHKKLTLDLDPLVTVLVGPSDVGKSAILRALKWLCTNRPQGSAFLRHEAKQCRVTLAVDGHTITRTKGIKNLYRLDDHVYKAFGSEVPEPIAQLLNVGAVNFAGQLEAPFWFLKSPGEVAKELNSVVNLTLIDTVQGRSAAELRQAQATEEVSKQRLEQAKKRCQELAWVEEAHESLLELSRLEEKRDQLGVRIARLERLLAEVGRVKEEVDRLSGAILCLKRVVRRAERAKALRDRMERLQGLLEKIRREEEATCRLARQVKQARQELQEKLQGQCPLCGGRLPKNVGVISPVGRGTTK